MLNEFRGAMLGAAMGDALGMPGESEPTRFDHPVTGFLRPSKWHPNRGLSPGQYTDDTQMMLIAAGLFAENVNRASDDALFSVEKYSESLLNLYSSGRMRFLDATVTSACEHMKAGYEVSGIYSTTSGCIPPGLPFALVYRDPVSLREHLVEACAVTHTHPAAHAAAVSFAMLISATINGHSDPFSVAVDSAFPEDVTLGQKIETALSLEKEGISLDAALSVIGNDLSVYQTLPLAIFIISRYGETDDLFTIAASVGGNTDTIGFICGAWAGACYGSTGLPTDLLI
ncbi:MAG: ADP-ribosylglycohydrolase family protein, partial [Euryarchaeota archaeon]|nr:ADP-ribosylglycohydrolase family protein [Euryarchaeota archaeon]